MMIKRMLSVRILLIMLSVSFSSSVQASSLNSLSKEELYSILLEGRYLKSPKMIYPPKPQKFKKLAVTATAYTSHVAQTDSTPNIAAWGDRLAPGMKVIAVSRDLLKEYGLKRGSRVKIKGLPGYYLVLDKMNKRWRKKIDIYMGMNKRDAFKWGRKEVVIEWTS